MYPSQNIDMLCFSLTYGSKNFLSVPIDGTWTLQERDRVKDINVLFVDEHFPDTLWMLIICEKFSVMVSDNCTNLWHREWMEQAVFSMSIFQNNHCSFTERDYDLQNHEGLERLNVPDVCLLLWSEP